MVSGLFRFFRVWGKGLGAWGLGQAMWHAPAPKRVLSWKIFSFVVETEEPPQPLHVSPATSVYFGISLRTIFFFVFVFVCVLAGYYACSAFDNALNPIEEAGSPTSILHQERVLCWPNDYCSPFVFSVPELALFDAGIHSALFRQLFLLYDHFQWT